MKKIENVLIPLILVMLMLIFLTGSTTLDIHLHDTYFILAHAHLAKWFLYWLVVIFILYTVIRYRHKRVNRTWAIAHISITIVLIAVIWFLVVSMGRRFIAFEQALWNWELYNQLIVIGALAFLLTQIVFLVYFVTRLFQTPDPQ